MKLPTNPIWQASDYVRGTGGQECGEQWYFVPRGYVQVIPDPRGIGKSDGESRLAATGKDGYDLIEWIAEQPWCNGNVGMIGMSAYAGAQYPIAAEQPPHLKAIMPFEGGTGRPTHGGVFAHGFSGAFFGHGAWLSAARIKSVPRPASFDEFSEQELRKKIKEVQSDPDIMSVPYYYLLTLAPERHPNTFDQMLHPYPDPAIESQTRYNQLKDIKIPTYAGSRWNAWVIHLHGAFDGFDNIDAPKEQKKMLIVPSDNYGGMDRPYHEIQDVILRWYDHWLKDNDTGIMNEPPITLFIPGINKWRYENEWPLAATQWTKFYLREGASCQPKRQMLTRTLWSSPAIRGPILFRAVSALILAPGEILSPR